MDDYERDEILRMLDEMKEGCRRANEQRVAAEILTHIDPKPVVGPQFIGGPFDGDSVVEKIGQPLSRERRVRLAPPPRFSAFLSAVPVSAPVMRYVEYERRRDGHFHFTWENA